MEWLGNKNHDHMCCSWDMVCDGCNCYFSFLAIFCSFTPLTAQKIKISKKWKKKMPTDFIILHKCTKNYDHMLYCSWDAACETCNCYFLFWVIFCPLMPITAPKMKIKKKNKKSVEISTFYTIVLKIMIIRYTVPDI